MARALINVPPKAKRGDIIEIKTLISHVMEPGYRPDSTGNVLPRDIINLFVCTYNGRGDFPRRAVRRGRRQSVHVVLDGRDRERQARVQMERATTGFRRRRPRPSPSNEHLASGLVAT